MINERYRQVNAMNFIVTSAEQEIYSQTGVKVKLLITNADDAILSEKSPEGLLQVVANVLGMQYSDYEVMNRTNKYIHLRFIGAFFLRQYFPKFTLKQIGEIFKQDHATVINGVKTAKFYLQSGNIDFNHKYNIVLNAITQWIAE